MLTFFLMALLLVGSLATVDECSYDSSLGTTDSDCPISELTGRTRIFPGGETQCLVVADNNPYFFEVFPGSGDEANNLLLSFPGGGYCGSATECTVLGFADREPRALETGIYNVEREDNPFLNWTIVNVLYCSGDAFTGNAMSRNGAVAWKGQINTRVVLDWVEVNFPTPDRLLLMGCSAGAAGLQYWSKTILEFYSNKPTVVSVLYDSMVGEILQFRRFVRTFRNTWNSCNAEIMKISDEQYQDCVRGRYDLVDDQQVTQALHRDIPFAYASFKEDDMLDLPYCASVWPFPCYQSIRYSAMRRVLNRLTLDDMETNNVVSFFVNAVGHCFTDRDRDFFRIGLGPNRGFSGEYSGEQFSDWISTYAYRDPSSTVIESRCDRGWLNWLFYDGSCDERLTAAQFRP